MEDLKRLFETLKGTGITSVKIEEGSKYPSGTYVFRNGEWYKEVYIKIDYIEKAEASKKKRKFDYSTDGYRLAKQYLIDIGEWDRVSKGGFSTDGYSIVHEANSIWNSKVSVEFEKKVPKK